MSFELECACVYLWWAMLILIVKIHLQPMNNSANKIEINEDKNKWIWLDKDYRYFM